MVTIYKKYNKYSIEEAYEGLTVEKYLKEVVKLSGRKLQQLTRKKGILLNGKSVFLQKTLKPKDVLKILIPKDNEYGVLPEDGEVNIIYEDDYLVVANKPAYQLVHPTGHTTTSTLANFLAFNFKTRNILKTIRPIHRLDRDTSGCVIFAKDGHTHFLLEELLKTKALNRKYIAIVKGHIKPKVGTISASIALHPKLSNRRIINNEGDKAITHYKCLKLFENASMVELDLETGRTHQIRLHLAHIGFPILGDNMYGIKSPLIKRQALHAASITFTHPYENIPITIKAPLPEDFVNLLKVLETD